ncbi:MAG: EutN/CcmL family microcompartment protein [Planctomycetes bacterium]|nr:EutN/CcmL family microcompartment protein [Planctomycetota bacterium]
MILCRVQGQVVATIKHPAYENRRMLLLDRIDPAGKESGGYLVAVDTVGANAGQTVLVIDEGNSARQVLGDSQVPIRSVIVGIVDDVNMI